MSPVSDITAELFVPGRLCLFGEHSDWAAQFGRHRGFCLVTGTDQGLRATARRSDSFRVETPMPDEFGRAIGPAGKFRCDWDASALLSAAKDAQEFFRYCAGTAHEMLLRGDVSGGIDLRISAMDLPLQRGVSSSAAVCILVARAFDAIYSLGLFPHELMDIAYRGERLTGSQCGRMDQACIYGRVPVLLTFGGDDSIRVEPVFPGGEIEMFFVDLGGEKDTIRILADLREAYPHNEQLQRALGEENERIARLAYQALSAGDGRALGALMNEAQGLFDERVAPHSPEQLASPLLHELLNEPAIAQNVWGSKGVGSQGDGTAQFVARSAADRDHAMREIVRLHPRMQCFPLTILPVHGTRLKQEK